MNEIKLTLRISNDSILHDAIVRTEDNVTINAYVLFGSDPVHFVVKSTDVAKMKSLKCGDYIDVIGSLSKNEGCTVLIIEASNVSLVDIEEKDNTYLWDE